MDKKKRKETNSSRFITIGIILLAVFLIFFTVKPVRSIK